MNKKLRFILIATLLSLMALAGGVLYALPDKQSSKVVEAQAASMPVTEAHDSTPAVLEESQSNISPQTTPAIKPSPIPSPTPPVQETPMYGEYPNNPGSYGVFNKTAVMDAAGIVEADRPYVLNILRSWTYKNPDGFFGLCGAAIKSKLFGDDWETNPITQMKYCDYYAKAHYGSWATAAEHFQVSKDW
jgi:hypothetical protein